MAEPKRKWIKIIAPRILNNAEVGETLCGNVNKVIGKVVEVNVGFVLNDGRRHHMKLKLMIKEVKNDMANTNVIGYNVVRAHIKRSVRKGRDKVEDSFVVECKDKIKVKIKPFVVTRYKAKRSVLTELRKKVKEFCLDYCKRVNYEELIRFVISNSLQRDLKRGLKKIFPVAFTEMRVLERI